MNFGTLPSCTRPKDVSRQAAADDLRGLHLLAGSLLSYRARPILPEEKLPVPATWAVPRAPCPLPFQRGPLLRQTPSYIGRCPSRVPTDCRVCAEDSHETRIIAVRAGR